MVLPSDYHLALRDWMKRHRVSAGEYAGVLIISNLDGLLRVAGSPRRLTPDERALVKEARARNRIDLTHPIRRESTLDDALGARVHALLIDICEELDAVGVPASPNLGLGVISGDEVFGAEVQVHEMERLYELMRAEGFEARSAR